MKLIIHLLKRIKRNWRFEFNLIVCCITIAVFYVIRLQLFGNSLALTNDNYSLGYPLRILVSSSIQNGIFPLWDHWTHGGMPLNSPLNMLSFSPIVLLLSLFGIYSIHTYVIEILIVHIAGFIGIYIWLSLYSSKSSSLVVAFCFTMLGSQITQTQINFESVVSVAVLPWIAIGMKYCMRGMLKGIGILAFAIWIILTTGYLGMNVIVIEFVTFFILVEAIILLLVKKLAWKEFLLGIYYILCGLFLGGLIVNYPFVENFIYYGTSFATMRDASFTPYAASANLFSLFTLYFPNHIWSFSGDGFSAFTGIMFFGSIPLYMVIYSLTKRKNWTCTILLLCFFILSFLTMLSPKYFFARWISMNFPLLKYIRWHVWFLPISVFFLATLASIGMTEFFDDKWKRTKMLAYIVFVIGAFLVAIKQSGSIFTSIKTYLFYPQTSIYIVLGILIILSFQKLNKLLYIVSIIEMVIVSWSFGLFGNNLYYRGLTVQEAKAREAIKIQTQYFPSIQNERSGEDSHINPQYYSKQPALYGYDPVIHPALASFVNTPEYPVVMKYLFYPVNPTGYPDMNGDFTINLIRLTPSSAEASIRIQSDKKIVWSSPHSPFWMLSIDSVATQTQQSRFGLTQFSLNKGTHVIRFAYRPPYFIPSMLLSLFCLGISIYLFTKKLGHKIDTMQSRSKKLYAKKRHR